MLVKDSLIHGMGIFADRDYKQDEEICRIGSSKLVVFLNHSCQPSCYLKEFTDNYADGILYAKDLKAGQEITIDYRHGKHTYVWEAIKAEGGCKCPYHESK